KDSSRDSSVIGLTSVRMEVATHGCLCWSACVAHRLICAGNGISDLFAIPSDGGDIVNLTNTADISETAAVWSPDGKRIAISYKPTQSPVYDIAILDWKTREVRNLTQEKAKDHGWIDPVWSPDGKVIYSIRYSSSLNDSDLNRIDLATGVTESLTPHDG